MTCVSEWELSLHTNRRQTPLSHVSACEETSLATISALPNVPHNATQQHPPGGHIISASDPAPSQLPTRSFAAYSHCAPHSSYPIGVAQTECLERHQLEDGRPCTEYAEYKTVLGAMHVLEEIDVNKEVTHAGDGSSHVRDNPLVNHRCWAEEDLGPFSQDILRDAHSLLSVNPNVSGENALYNKNWTDLDKIHFIRILVEDSEITCQWGACGDRLKIKEIKAHLVHTHDVKSNPKPYDCFWNDCYTGKPMTELPSLVRHVQEQHGSVYKFWPCPTCEERFTREETLLRHFEKCAGHSKRRVEPRGQMGYY